MVIDAGSAENEAPNLRKPEKRGRGAAAERLLGEKKAEKIPILPFESSLSYVFRMVGGKETAIEAARMMQSEDERLKKVVYAHDQATDRDKSSLKLEDLCAAADITPDDFLGIIIPGLWRRNLDIGKLLAAMAHPKVVEATITAAQGQWGGMDRQMLLQANGFLPTKTGPSIVIDNSRKTLVAGGGGKAVDTSGPGLPSFEQDAIEGAQVLRGDSGTGLNNKLLPAPRDNQAVLPPGVKEKSSSSSCNSEEVLDAEEVDV